MSYFLRSTAASTARPPDQRPVLENAGRAGRLAKWWRRRCHEPSAAEDLRALTFQVATDPRTLAQAFKYLRYHGGQAPGMDELTYADLAACHGGMWGVCRGLSEALRSGEY